MSSSIRRVVQVLFLLLSGSAYAQPLFPPHEPSLITAGYSVPIGQVPLRSGCRVGGSFSLANEHNLYDPLDDVLIQTDAETWVLVASLRQAGRYGEFSMNVPVKLIWGGALDDPLNAYHSLADLNTIIHEPGQVYSVALSGGQVRSYSGAVLTLGNPDLSWGYSFGRPWVKVQLGVPFGSEMHFVNTHAWRAALSAGYDADHWGVAAQWTQPLNPRQTALNFLGVQPSLAVRGWAAFAFPGRVEVEVRSSPLGDAGYFSRLNVALRFVMRHLSFQEDPAYPLPDVAFSGVQEWSCPW